MQAPGGKDEDRDGGFEYGGWTVPYWHDDIGRNFFELMKDVDALLLACSRSRLCREGPCRRVVRAMPAQGPSVAPLPRDDACCCPTS
jgi:hypothetical protein